MSQPKRVVLIAGEASGDLLGANLMQTLKSNHPFIEFYGVGGDRMLEEGLQPFFPMSDINLMGVIEILCQLPRVFKRLKETVQQIESLKPDVVVTIDAQGFSLRLQKRLKKINILGVHYVSPTVWAWRAHRAKVLAANTDQILCLYPFEPNYFIREGGRASFVGHPIIGQGIEKGDGKVFREKYSISQSQKIVSVLPGSRGFEIQSLTPLFKKVAEELCETNSDLHFVVPTLPYRVKTLKSLLEGWKVPHTIVDSTEDKYAAFNASIFSMAASGTIALELAAAGVPTIIAYKVNALTAFILRRMVDTPFACMINILNQKLVVPELLQENCTVKTIKQEALHLLESKEAREHQKKYMRKAIDLLTVAKKAPGEKAAEVISGYLN